MSKHSKMTPHQVAVAAEAYAACLLAQGGCEVSVQYGANQPGYDLVAVLGKVAVRISVKGSQDGGWGLSQGYKSKATYQEAADRWCDKQDPQTVFCLVQFESVPFGTAPRVYFAWPHEISAQLKASRAGVGDTVLHEDFTHTGGVGKGFRNQLPESWRATPQRIVDLFSGSRLA
jgi:hypothetical protein